MAKLMEIVKQMYPYFMCLFSEAGMIFVRNNKQLDLTETEKSKLSLIHSTA